MPARLEALGTAAGLDRAALHSQLAAALSVVLHLARDRSGRRRIAEVRVLEREASGLVRTVPALRWGPQAFVAQRGWPRLRELLRADGEELADAENPAGGAELTGGVAPRGGLELVGGRADGVVGAVSIGGNVVSG